MEVLALAAIAGIIILLQASLFKHTAFKKLEYKCGFSVNEAHEGDEIYLIETIYNKKLLPVPWLKVEINSSKWLEFAETRSVIAQENRYVTSSFFLKSYQKVTRRWKLKCLKRGVFCIDTVTLITGDLLGNASDSIPVDINAVIQVYPQTINLEETFMPVSYLQGDTIVKRWINEDPFIISGTREYTTRDPMNKIHWSSTARMGRLMVRQNDFTSQYGLSVILNIQSIENEYFDAVYKDFIELGIKAAATIFDKALRNGTPARLATNGSTFDGGRQMVYTQEASGRSHISSLLSILARLELSRIKDFEDFLIDISEDITNSEVVLITSYLTENICNLLRRMKLRNNAIRILITNKSIETAALPQDMDIYILKEGILPDVE
ncbi:MAG TPA: DUF58 domain-containing protein [Clostridiaceae bacterium]|nr:DUF58 domain-containing protein [Clostridiaceae bacterium]